MADSYTTRNRLRLIETGSRPNTWGSILNSDALGLGDVALDGWTTKALTTNVTLTSSNGATDEARSRVLKFTGTGAYQVTIPSLEKWYLIDNQCTGNLTITTGSGTTAVLAATESTAVYCDGTNVKAIGVGSLSVKGYVDSLAGTPVGAIRGLTLSTAGSSATFSVAAGIAADSVYSGYMTLGSAISKTTSAWAVGSASGGLDTGSIANSTWYHAFLIRRPDTSVVDVLFSTSATAPTMPTNYTQKRRIGSIRTNGSAQWVKFIQIGDEFLWDAPVADATSQAVGTSGVNITLTVPPVITPLAIINAAMQSNTALIALLIHSKLIANQVANSPVGNVQFYTQAVNGAPAGALRLLADTSSQVRAVSTATSETCNLWVATLGWVDRRGQD